MINYDYCAALLVSNLATSVSALWEREQPTLHAPIAHYVP